MTLGLHPECKERLITFVAQALTAVLVQNGWYPDWASTGPLSKADAILPNAGPVRQRLNTFAEDDAFSEFARDHITRGLAEFRELALRS